MTDHSFIQEKTVTSILRPSNICYRKETTPISQHSNSHNKGGPLAVDWKQAGKGLGGGEATLYQVQMIKRGIMTHTV